MISDTVRWLSRGQRSTLRFLITIALVLASVHAQSAQWFVLSGGASVAFVPQFLTIQAGDSVTFLNLGGYHNVVADDGAFRCAHGCDDDGVGGSGTPSSDLWFSTITLQAPGQVGYFCEPHGSPGEGMYGSITVLAAPVAPALEPVPAGGAPQETMLALAIVALALWNLRRAAAAGALGKLLSRRR